MKEFAIRFKLTFILLLVVALLGFSFSSMAQKADILADAGAEEMFMELNPNAVKSGEDIIIRYRMVEDGELVVYLTDEDEKIVFLYSEDFRNGDNNIILSTNGIEPGNYQIKINSDSKSSIQNFKVLAAPKQE